jgi:hypothetical protein
MKKVSKGLMLTALCCISSNIFGQDTTNMGTEFWVGYGHHQFMESGTNTQNMVLYLSTGSQAATVTVAIDSSGGGSLATWTKTYNIPAYTAIVSDIIPKGVTNAPTSADANYDARLYSIGPPAGTGGAGVFRDKGIHIQSTAPIAAYTHIYGSASSGASMLLPIEAWGYTYTVINSKQSYASNCYAWAFVIAKEDNTIIQVIPSVKTRAQDKTGLAQGIAKTITLMKGQIYQVIGANLLSDVNGNGGASADGYELTGTIIKSLSPGKQVAVFAGSSRTNNAASCGTGGGDNDIQQIFPHHSWGKKFLTAPTSSSGSASTLATNIYKIIVKDPTTLVSRNGVMLTSLINNNYYQFESNTADYIQSDKPITVAQFMLGGACNPGGSLGDPDMYYLSSIEQGINSVRGYRTTRENISINYITLIVPNGGTGLSSLQIDNSSAFDHTFTHPQNSAYTVVIKRWSPAAQSQFTIQSDSAFIGITYGEGSVESYGYNIGAKFKDIGVFRTTWNGNSSTDWINPANWSAGVIPTLDDEITIPAGTPFHAVIPVNEIGACKKITLGTGATLTVNGKLNVSGKPIE